MANRVLYFAILCYSTWVTGVKAIGTTKYALAATTRLLMLAQITSPILSTITTISTEQIRETSEYLVRRSFWRMASLWLFRHIYANATVQSGPNYSTNTYTITNNYYYYGGHPTPRDLVPSSEHSGLNQSQSGYPWSVDSAAGSSRSVALSATAGNRQSVEADSPHSHTSKSSYEILKITHTVSRARNAAFAGREALLNELITTSTTNRTQNYGSSDRESCRSLLNLKRVYAGDENLSS